MSADRVTQLKIRGMRCIATVELEVGAFTVLIGENGVGKSTIVEAIELLRLAATERPFLSRLYTRHGGTRLVREGDHAFELEIAFNDRLHYRLGISRKDNHLIVADEAVVEANQSVMWRIDNAFSIMGPDGTTVVQGGHVDADETVISQSKFLKVPQLDRVYRALTLLEVHKPLDLRSPWMAAQPTPNARSSNVARPADRLELGGYNLVNVYAELRNQRNWLEILGRLRLGLGDVDDVLLKADPSGGSVGLWIRWEKGLEVSLAELSDGQVTYLAHVAVQLQRRKFEPSLVVVDEPELHLHPGLTKLVEAGFEELSEASPALIATQSDAFLDAVTDPIRSVALCRLDHERRTEITRPDRESLETWLGDFRGIGHLRREGLEPVIFPRVS